MEVEKRSIPMFLAREPSRLIGPIASGRRRERELNQMFKIPTRRTCTNSQLVVSNFEQNVCQVFRMREHRVMARRQVVHLPSKFLSPRGKHFHD